MSKTHYPKLVIATVKNLFGETWTSAYHSMGEARARAIHQSGFQNAEAQFDAWVMTPRGWINV
jgi:hypothetical protein